MCFSPLFYMETFTSLKYWLALREKRMMELTRFLVVRTRTFGRERERLPSQGTMGEDPPSRRRGLLALASNLGQAAQLVLRPILTSDMC